MLRSSVIGRLAAAAVLALLLMLSPSPSAAAPARPQPPVPVPPSTPPAPPPPTTTAPPGNGLCPNGLLLGTVCKGLGGLAAGAVTAGFDQLASRAAEAATALLGRVAKVIDHMTSPHLDAAWFGDHYSLMFALAGLLGLPFLLLAVLQCAIRGDWTEALRCAVLYPPLAFGGAAAAIVLADLLLQAADELAAAAVGGTGADTTAFFTKLGHALAISGGASATPSLPIGLTFGGALLVGGGALALWLELLLRSAAIYTGVLFVPIAFAMLIWPATRRGAKLLVEFLCAAIFAKPVMVAIVSLAAAGLGQTSPGDDFEALLVGAAVLLLAVFTPLGLLAVIPWAEQAVGAARSQRPGLRHARAAVAATTGVGLAVRTVQVRRAEARWAQLSMHSGWAAGGQLGQASTRPPVRDQSQPAAGGGTGRPPASPPPSPPPPVPRPKGGGTT